MSERYGAGWDALSRQVRAEEPLCRVCLASGRTSLTTQCDHIIPKARGGTDARTNLQGICGPCHDAKTARERREAPRSDSLAP